MIRPRFRWFEFEDLPWFPAPIRVGMTDFLDLAIRLLNVYRPAVPLLAALLKRSGQTNLVDLGSGGGGGLGQLLPYVRVATGLPVTALLTDKYPNLEAFQRLARQSDGGLRYVTTSVDATRVPSHLKGLRTLFSAFHHFEPDVARAILGDAVRQRVALGVFEGTTRHPLERVGVLLLPLAVWALTPWLRPRRALRWWFTYPLPLIPLATLWDGWVSLQRMYTPRELMALAHQATDGSAYVWWSGCVGRGPGRGVTYLVGCPGTVAEAHAGALDGAGR